MKVNNENNGVLKKSLIFLNKDCNERNSVLKEMIRSVYNADLILDENLFLKAVLDREAEIPTAIGYEIAMPHGKSSTVKEPFIGFYRSTELFEWTNGIDEKVKLIFLIGVPEENKGNMHLKFISQLSKKLLDEDFRLRLENESNVNEVFNILNSIKL